MSVSTEEELNIESITVHTVWHKFSNWLIKTYGKDLHSDWDKIEFTDASGKKRFFKSRNFNELELSRRLVGHEVMNRIEKYVKRCTPQIKIVRCDDDVYATSFILLIPHPKHGITIMYIPQCTNIQNRFFLYNSHYKSLIKALSDMSIEVFKH